MVHHTNIAVIDSGIDIQSDYFKSRIIDGISIKYDFSNKKILYQKEFFDENGHGTQCAHIISKEASKAKFFIIKILDKNAQSSSACLIEALKLLLDMDIRIISLSLSTINNYYRNELEGICSELIRNGKILVSSLDNRCKKSFPAVFGSVIGVRGSILNKANSYWYNKIYDIQCVEDIIPVMVRTINNSYVLFGGNSKASALISGKICNILNNHPHISSDELNILLEKNATRTYWNEEDIIKDPRIFDEVNGNLENYDVGYLKEIENIFEKYLHITEKKLIYKQKLFHPAIGINSMNCYSIIKAIENTFNLKLNYSLINFNTFESIYSLINFIKESQKTG